MSNIKYLEEEAKHLARVGKNIKQMRRDHRKRVVETISDNPEDTRRLVEILKATAEGDADD